MESGHYRVGAQYFANEDQMLFTSVATGHKMGGMYEMADFCNHGCLELLSLRSRGSDDLRAGLEGHARRWSRATQCDGVLQRLHRHAEHRR
jgi:hypothetical protein